MSSFTDFFLYRIENRIHLCIRISIANNEVVTFDSVPFNMRVARDVQQFKLSGYEQYDLQVDFVEAI